MNKKNFIPLVIVPVVFFLTLALNSALAFNNSINNDCVALVIGNAAYPYKNRLSNPVNDANLIAETLRSIGFTLVGNEAHTNLDKQGFDTCIRQFGEMSKNKKVAMIYYSGHGAQIDGENYLIPTNSRISFKEQIRTEFVNMNHILDLMSASGARIKIIVLDACRAKPFNKDWNSVVTELNEMTAPNGTLIAYATSPGKTATDGAGSNSPYAEALAKNLKHPGYSIDEIFMNVSKDVQQETSGLQIPWKMDNLTEKYYFIPPIVAQTPTQQPMANNINIYHQAQQIKPVLNPPSSPAPTLPIIQQPQQFLSYKPPIKDDISGMEFVWIPGGNYRMRCPNLMLDSACKDFSAEKNIKGFWIGKYLITQSQWKRIMDNNPSHFRAPLLFGDSSYPVDSVSYYAAKEFIRTLNQNSKLKFRLPTEAEWDYSSRNLNKSTMELDSSAWYQENSYGTTHPVGTKAPNAFGLYDMYGNVWEWCEDVSIQYSPSGEKMEPPILTHVIRGGSFYTKLNQIYESARSHCIPNYISKEIGLRLVLVDDSQK